MANERSELILRVDDLTHKVLRCESEVAVGETFDLVFFGGRVWDGDSAKVFLYDDKERLLWSASGVVEARSDGAFVISGCVIDTEQAAAYANSGHKLGRRVYGELIRVDVEGERTDYGDFSFLLHKGVSADGTPLVKFLDDLSAHEVDSEAHEDIRQEIAQVETSILASVSQDIEEHAVVEETARNEAIHRAIIDLRSELEGGADGIGAGAVAEATRQAALAGEIAVGVADSARAAAVSAETASQAAKDGAGYLNRIINASNSALASKDQAQAFAKSSREAKEEAEAYVASVNSDRVAVEAARDDVLEARDDVIAAQGAVGGLLSSALESESTARESASTASRAANDAKRAKSDAESARDRAVVARDEAEAFAAGAARSAEASEASAVRSENAAAQAAQEAAENVTALLQVKVEAADAAKTAAEDAKTAAEAAKAGAEAAKTAAETAQGKAEAAKTAAETAQGKAEDARDAAAQSATDLAEAVSTAESLDGRITLIEHGKGIVKKADGSVEVYTRLPFGDGTLKVVKDVTNAKMVVPYERDISEVYACYGDGVYAYIYCSGKFMAAYDRGCNRVAAAMDRKGYAFTLYNHCAIFDGEYWFICSGKYLYKVSASGDLVKGVLVESEVYSNLYPVFNPKTGHLVILNPASAIWNAKETSAYSNILVYDKDLNPVLNDDGSRREYRYPRQTCFPLGYTDSSSGLTSDGTGLGFFAGDEPDVFITVNTCYFIFVRGDIRGNNIIFYGDGVSLNKLGDADELIQVREAIPRVDENGYTVYKKDEAGNYILKKNYPSNGNGVIIPETDDGEIIRGYIAVQDRASMGKAGAFRWHPKIERRNQNTTGFGTVYMMTDGVDRYWITPDDQIVDLYRLNDSKWTSRKTPLDSNGNLFLKARGKMERASGFTTKYTIPFLVGNASWDWSFDIGNELLCYETLGTNALSRFFCAKSNFNVDSAITCDTNDRIPLTIKISHNRFNAEPDNATWAMMSSPVLIVTRDWVMGGILS